MAQFGVHLAQVLTVLLAAASVLLGLLVLVAHFRHQTGRPAPQPVHARTPVRGGDYGAIGGRHLSPDLTPLPSRDPPTVPLDSRQGPPLRS